MRFQVSWWDAHDGLGTATSDDGMEFLIHKSSLSAGQRQVIAAGMTIVAQAKDLGSGVVVLEQIKILKAKSSAKIVSQETEDEVLAA